jgi:hypothetical protein
LRVKPFYASLKNMIPALSRDFEQLEDIGAIHAEWSEAGSDADRVSINLNWPQEIDEGEFLLRMKTMPKGKTFKFLS